MLHFFLLDFAMCWVCFVLRVVCYTMCVCVSYVTQCVCVVCYTGAQEVHRWWLWWRSENCTEALRLQKWKDCVHHGWVQCAGLRIPWENEHFTGQWRGEFWFPPWLVGFSIVVPGLTLVLSDSVWRFPACLRVTSFPHSWHNARKELRKKDWCWIPMKSSTNGSPAKWSEISTWCSPWTPLQKGWRTEPPPPPLCSTGLGLLGTLLLYWMLYSFHILIFFFLFSLLRCVLNWFGDWSTEALYQVAKEFTSKMDLEKPNYIVPDYMPAVYDKLPQTPSHREAIVNGCVFVHQTLHQVHTQPPPFFNIKCLASAVSRGMCLLLLSLGGGTANG